MATRIQVRQGNLSELPILASGEQGYALDANRLFIGNSPISLGFGDGSTVDFIVPTGTVDLDVIPSYEVRVDGVQSDILLAQDKQIKMVQAPASGSTVELYYNTELLTYIPDAERDTPVQETLDAAGGQLTTLSIDPLRYDSGEIKYTITDGTETRSGKITVSLLNISDDYVTSNDTVLSTDFSLVDNSGVYKLAYTGTGTDLTVSYVTNLWKS